MPAAACDTWTEAACHYAGDYGWRVMPYHLTAPDGLCTCGEPACATPGAHPCETDGRGRASQDPATILEWGSRWPDARIGVSTGAGSGIVALEIDRTRQPEGLAALEKRFERLSFTAWFEEPRVREVYLFRHPGVTLPSRATIMEGVTLYGDGARIVVPTFLARSIRDRLRWMESPDLTRPVLPPRWLLRAAGTAHLPAEYDRPDLFEDAQSAGDGAAKEAEVTFTTAAELPLDVLSDTTWVAKPWAASGSVTVLTGMSKIAGKTTWLLHLVRSVLTGSRFIFSHCGASPVVYLTEQSRHTFSRALHENGLIDVSVRSRLCVLYGPEMSHRMNWRELIEAAVAQCKKLQARLLVIDALDFFANVGGDAAEIGSRDLTDPLTDAARQGLAVVAVYQQFAAEGDLADTVHHLGKLASVADLILSIKREREGHASMRRIEALSRFRETPAVSHVELRGDHYLPVEQRFGPLFKSQGLLSEHGDETAIDPAPVTFFRGASA